MLLPWYLWWLSLSNTWYEVRCPCPTKKLCNFDKLLWVPLSFFVSKKFGSQKKCVFLWDTYYVPNVPNEQSDTHCLHNYTQYSLGKVTKKLVLLALHGIFNIEICQKGT